MNNFVCIYYQYHLWRITVQIIECKIFSSYDFLQWTLYYTIFPSFITFIPPHSDPFLTFTLVFSWDLAHPYHTLILGSLLLTNALALPWSMATPEVWVAAHLLRPPAHWNILKFHSHPSTWSSSGCWHQYRLGRLLRYTVKSYIVLCRGDIVIWRIKIAAYVERREIVQVQLTSEKYMFNISWSAWCTCSLYLSYPLSIMATQPSRSSRMRVKFMSITPAFTPVLPKCGTCVNKGKEQHMQAYSICKCKNNTGAQAKNLKYFRLFQNE